MRQNCSGQFLWKKFIEFNILYGQEYVYVTKCLNLNYSSYLKFLILVSEHHQKCSQMKKFLIEQSL